MPELLVIWADLLEEAGVLAHPASLRSDWVAAFTGLGGRLHVEWVAGLSGIRTQANGFNNPIGVVSATSIQRFGFGFSDIHAISIHEKPGEFKRQKDENGTTVQN